MAGDAIQEKGSSWPVVLPDVPVKHPHLPATAQIYWAERARGGLGVCHSFLPL